jgi:hypothetical protein
VSPHLEAHAMAGWGHPCSGGPSSGSEQTNIWKELAGELSEENLALRVRVRKLEAELAALRSR